MMAQTVLQSRRANYAFHTRVNFDLGRKKSRMTKEKGMDMFRIAYCTLLVLGPMSHAARWIEYLCNHVHLLNSAKDQTLT